MPVLRGLTPPLELRPAARFPTKAQLIPLFYAELGQHLKRCVAPSRPLESNERAQLRRAGLHDSERRLCHFLGDDVVGVSAQ